MPARPVIRRRQPAVPLEPLPHRLQHQSPSPAPLDRARVARLAVRVGVALAVARLRVGPAAPNGRRCAARQSHRSVEGAITVDAPPEDIWPWLVQMGYQRGGLHS